MIHDYLPPLSPSGLRWTRFLLLAVTLIGLAMLSVRLSGVLTPLVAAMAIAYILNPVVSRLEQWGIRRLTSVVVGMILLVVAGAAILLLGAAQLYQLSEDLPRYFQMLRERFSDFLPGFQLSAQTRERVLSLAQAQGMSFAQAAAGFASRWLADALYWLSLTVLLPVYSFFFLLKFNAIIAHVDRRLPYGYAPTIRRIVVTADRAIADFFRGRLVVCAVVGALTGIGWWIVGVPNSFLLGALLGALNLVPFLSIIALPVALIAVYVACIQSGAPWALPVVETMGVFMLVQAIEAFLLSPFIGSKACGLNPITNVIVLLIGAELGGALGMLLAVPVASTIKSLALEYVMPHVDRLARCPAPAVAQAGPDLETSRCAPPLSSSTVGQPAGPVSQSSGAT